MVKTRLIPVYDQVNTKRLLGHLDVTGCRYRGPLVFVVAGEPRFREPWEDIGPALNSRRVTFHKDHVLSEDGWDLVVVLLTDASLEDLTQLRQFQPIYRIDPRTAYEKAKEEAERYYRTLSANPYYLW